MKSIIVPHDNVLQRILSFAKKEECVRAVMLNGSRVNSNSPKDKFQDYDIVFFVENFKKNDYRLNTNWIYEEFGTPVIVQQNDFNEDGYIFLIQMDDYRVDLQFYNIEKINEKAVEDTLSLFILDKDNKAPTLPQPTDSMHWVKKPSKKEFEKTLNEAWWIQTYVAKGIWRDQFPYVRRTYDRYLMDAIRKLVSWDIGLAKDWKVNCGSAHKWFNRFMSKAEYKEFIELHSTKDYNDIWDSLVKAGNFIRKIGTRLADEFDYEYPYLDDERVRVYLCKVREECNDR